MRRVIASLLISSVLLAGCASSAEDVQATYVSPMQYADYNCKQVRMELMRVTRKVSELTGQQDKDASGDAVAMGVGLVLFWPALFFLMGDDHSAELSRLKGEYDALESVAIQKECDIADEIREAQKLREEREEKLKEQQKNLHQMND